MLVRKDIILLSNVAAIFHKAGLHTAVEDKYIRFTLSAGTYSIDDFSAVDKVGR